MNHTSTGNRETAIARMYVFLDVSSLRRMVTAEKGLTMPPPLSDELRNRIQLHLHNKMEVASIAKLEKVGKATIYRIIENLRNHGTPTAPPKGKTGRPFMLSPAARDFLRAFVESNPEAYQYEMQYELFDRFGLVVSQATISSTLYKMKVSRKGSAADRKRSRQEKEQITANQSR